MKTKTIKQTITFKANPHDVYEILMDEKKHSDLTGSRAKINQKVNGKFTVYEGAIEGVNLELILDKKIVQKWRYEDWPKNYYSTIKLELKKTGNGTKMIFTQIGVPQNKYKSIKQGWVDYYWEPIKKMLKQ